MIQETSHEAYRSVRVHIPTMEACVLDYIKAHRTATDDEICVGLPLRINSVTPLRGSLVKRGLVRNTGKRRPTRSGASAIVWEVA